MTKEKEYQPDLFQFPIQEVDEETKMNNINPSTLNHFHGITNKDSSNFLLDIEFHCRTYEYKTYAQKIRLFPSTL